MGGASLGEKVNKIKHELGLDISMPMAEALQTANGIMGLRPSNYTLPEQADLLLNVRRASNCSLDQRTTQALARSGAQMMGFTDKQQAKRDAAADALTEMVTKIKRELGLDPQASADACVPTSQPAPSCMPAMLASHSR